MGERGELCEFVFVPSFERSAAGLLGDGDIRELEQTLLANPRAGAVMRDTGGVRKVRVALEGRGKSGGARVLYLYVEIRERIYLLLCFPKNVQGNLTPDQARRIRGLVAQIHEEEEEGAKPWRATTISATR